jgi:hypothetical protein
MLKGGLQRYVAESGALHVAVISARHIEIVDALLSVILTMDQENRWLCLMAQNEVKE